MVYTKDKRGFYQKLRDKASSRNGVVVSKEYVNARSPMTFKCSNPKHPTFDNQPYKVLKENQWCPYCSGRKGDFSKRTKMIIESKGGKMIGTYKNNNTPIEVICDKGHVFFPLPSNVKANKWCPRCAGIVGDFELDLKKYVESKGGKLLSEYKGADEKVTVLCSKHGEFCSTPYHLKNRGHWCVRCSSSVGQEECHTIFEEITGYRFMAEYRLPCGRKKGNELRLDGYCHELKIAFEYHGEQHYNPVHHFGGEKKFLDTMARDQEKAELCKNLGIHLIIIPYSVKDKRAFIQEELKDFINIKE